jgi:hypothetical protein
MEEQLFADTSNEEYWALTNVFRLFIRLENDVHNIHDVIPASVRCIHAIKFLEKGLSDMSTFQNKSRHVFALLNILKGAYFNQYTKDERETIFEAFYKVALSAFPKESFESLAIATRRSINVLTDEAENGQYTEAKARITRLRKIYKVLIHKESSRILPGQHSGDVFLIKATIKCFRQNILAESIAFLDFSERLMKEEKIVSTISPQTLSAFASM